MSRKVIPYKIYGLDYVCLENAPIRHTKHGDILAADPATIENEVAREIICQGVPIRGAEVQFLRKCLGLSMERFGRLLGLSAPAILKWERAREKRLQLPNEIAVRVLIAEALNISLDGKLSTLKGMPDTPRRLLVQVQAGASPAFLSAREVTASRSRGVC
jgi:transcriptional regulator with XRE-family HTH domain